MLKQKSRWSSGKTLASHTNSPRFESRLGQCRYGSCVLLAKVAPRPFDRDIKLRSSLCMHAFKFMHGLKRTWMTKRKSRGPETGRYPACMWLLQTEACQSRNCKALVAQNGCSTQASHPVGWSWECSAQVHNKQTNKQTNKHTVKLSSMFIDNDGF